MPAAHAQEVASAGASLALRAVHNEDACVPLTGLPRTQLDELSHALAAGPITLDLLQALLAGGFGGTPLARQLADELAVRCVLPSALSCSEQAKWREVLLDALRLSPAAWEVEAVHARAALTDAAHPLLKALRDALYRPHDMPHAQWRTYRLAHADKDSHALALDWQRQQLQGHAMAGRHAGAREALRALAPDASAADLARAMQDVRRSEQREQGLLDPRIGVRRLVERNALGVTSDAWPAGFTTEGDDASLLLAPVTDGATQALAQLLLHASGGTVLHDATPRPVGRFDSLPHALTSLLSLPGQLDGLRHWGASVALAAERVAGGARPAARSGVREATRGYVSQADWPVQVQAIACGPLPAAGDAPDEPVQLHRQVMEALAGAPPKTQALTVPGQCRVDSWTASGLRAEQAAQIDAFMRRQLPANAGPDALQQAYAHQVGLTPQAAPHAPPLPPFSMHAASALDTHRLPRALAGALTDQGAAPMPATETPALLPGAGGLPIGGIPGHAPLLLLQGLIDSIGVEAWWRAFPGHVTRTPQGLRDALDALFTLAGEPLHGRAPHPESLQRFLASPQGQALVRSLEMAPDLADWQREQLAQGGPDTAAYLLMRLLAQLTRHGFVHSPPPRNKAERQADRVARHQLAGIGDALGRYLEWFGPHTPETGEVGFQRTMRRHMPGAQHPTPWDNALPYMHGRRVRPPADRCPPVDSNELRRWLVDGAQPLLDEATFQNLSDADTCLARIAVILTRTLQHHRPDNLRDFRPTLEHWRVPADALAAGDPQTPCWETGVGVYYHSTASMLRAWLALDPDPEPSPQLQALWRYVQSLVEPLQQLYSVVELELETADPYYVEGDATFARFRAALITPDGSFGQHLATTACAPDAPDVRQGLATMIGSTVTTALVAMDGRASTLWEQIVHGPHALQQWLDSKEGHDVFARWVPTAQHKTATVPWQSRARWLREAVLSQLPAQLRDRIPAMDDVPALYAHGDAPVLSLAVELMREDPSLHDHPEQALMLALALLPLETPADPARMPLSFPLLDAASATPGTNATTGATPAPASLLAPLPAWMTDPAPVAPSPLHIDNAALPSVDALLDSFGLRVLHGDDPGQRLHPADAWALMSRTQGFAEQGRRLLEQAGWLGGNATDARSPQGAQLRVAQAMLEHYIGLQQIQQLRDFFNDPAIVQYSFDTMLQRVRDTLDAQQPHASVAVRAVLEWLLLRELGQPALTVQGIPDGLTYASLQGSAFLQGVLLLEAIEPGASAHARFDQVSALAAQLAAPPAHTGEHDDLHAAWARAMLTPALLYALAHGHLTEVTALDAVTAAQASTALDILLQAQERHALHVDQLGSPPPRRLDLARRTLTEAGVDPSFWTQRLDELPAGLLARHGLVPSTRVGLEQSAVAKLAPPGMPGVDATSQVLSSGDDSLENLIVADAYLWTGGPSTQSRFDAAFEVYRQRVESGLAGLIEDLLHALPDADREVIARSTCTPLRVTAFGQEARQGLLLRCQPSDQPAVHFELVPSSGTLRRAVHDPASGDWVDAQAMIDGTRALRRDTRLTPVSGLTLHAADVSVDMGQDAATRQLADAAARLLWDPVLDQVREQVLAAGKTPLEALREREARFLEQVAEYTVPFFGCVKDLLAGQHSTATIAGCLLDGFAALGPALEFGQFLRSTVVHAGEQTITSLAANTGRALVTLATDLARQGGAGLIHDLARGSLQVGRQAVRAALRSADWLGTVLRGGRELGGVSHEVTRALADDVLTEHRLATLGHEDDVLAVGQSRGQPPQVVTAGTHGWYRYDPVEGAAYGAPGNPELIAPLPDALPVEPVDACVRISLDDAPDTRLVQTHDRWVVWLGDTPYLLDGTDGTLFRREVHGGELGELQDLDVRGCRVKHGVEAIDSVASCTKPVQLRFVPDRLVPLPEAPSLDDLASHAFGYREYTPSVITPEDLQPASVDADDDVLESVHTLWRDGTRRVGPGTPEETATLMVHDNKVQTRYEPRSKQGRPLPRKLSPLTPGEAEVLGVPTDPVYLPRIQGTQLIDDTLGLEDNVDPLTRTLINRQLPVIELGPIAEGVQDRRKLRGIRMTVQGTPAICIAPDRGVYYWAPEPAHAGEPLVFQRMEDRTDIEQYLQHSELHRLYRENPQSLPLRRNIEKMAFNYLRPGFSDTELKLYSTYEEYLTYCQQHGHRNLLETFATDVLSGKRQQDAFVRLSRQLIPDWKALRTGTVEERQAVADVLNALLPLRGKEADWVPLTAESLALPETASLLLKHFAGANFAFVRLETEAGSRIISSLSSGERAKKLELVAPADTDQITYVNAGRSGLPVNDALITLPVLSSPEGRIIVFPREGDSENWIFRWLMMALKSEDPAVRLVASEIKELELWSLLDTCTTCGGAVVPTAVQELRALGFKGKVSVKYMIDYVK